MIPRDPLKIGYYVVLPDDPLNEASPFQGFSKGWHELSWFLQQIATLPADIAEGVAAIDPLISQRMGGSRMVAWSPMMIDTLEQFSARQLGVFVVIFSADPEVGRRVEAWRAGQAIRCLHVSLTDIDGALPDRDFSEADVIAHCKTILAEHGDLLDPPRRALAQRCLDAWEPREPEPSGLAMMGHNVLAPNQLSLMRTNRSFEDGERFMGRTEEDYDEKILEIVRAVFAARERAGVREFHQVMLIHPEIYLVEPAFFRGAYQRVDGRRLNDPATRQVVRMLQTQSGFLSYGLSPQLLRASEMAQHVLAIRQQELTVFTMGVGLAASMTTSAVMRLRPAVNHVFPKLSRFARSVRSEKAEFKRKAQRLFSEIQDALKAALGPSRLDFLEEDVAGPVKIVSDAPIEWLPIRGLPLMLYWSRG